MSKDIEQDTLSIMTDRLFARVSDVVVNEPFIGNARGLSIFEKLAGIDDISRRKSLRVETKLPRTRLRSPA